MRSIRFYFSILVIIFLTSCGTGGTPPPAATETARLELPPTQAVNTVTAEPTLTSLPKATDTPRSSGSTPSPPNTPVGDCTQGWTQLRIGGYAKVAGEVNDPPNRVRSDPKKAADNTIAQIYPGTVVHVIEGPVCADGLAYWKIEEASLPGGVGWTAEGDGRGYWLEPYISVADTVQLSAYGVTFTVPGSWSNIPDAQSVTAGGDGVFCTWPDYIKITLTAYPAKSAWKPMIFVYQTDQKPNWYPFCEGVPMLKVHQYTLPRGDRFVFGSTNAKPIFNSELLYSYKGVTPDGKHIVFAFIPVNFPLLAYSFQDLALPAGGIPFDVNSQNWDGYYQSVGAQLEKAGNGEFTPSLDVVDAIVESISITTP